MTSDTAAGKPAQSLSRIQIRNKQRRFKVHRSSVADFCSILLREMDKADHSVSVAFVGSREMKSINLRYRGKSCPTDVLSFTYGDEILDGRPFLGEILVCPEVAANNARFYRTHPDREMKKLLVHGVLHLAGYDHEIDDGSMRHLQEKLVRRSFFRKASVILEVTKERR
ncbi:MAG: rRNA maturation RNase YbeY [Acidobacteriota bacterium]